MMYKLLHALMASILITLLAVMPAADASPGDSKEKVAAQYGEYRVVNDSEGRQWAKADWESRGKGAVAESYVHYFSRQDTKVTTVVAYQGGRVAQQYFTLDMPITISQFKAYFPEVYALLTDAKAKVFVAKSAERNGKFYEEHNPISFAAVIEKDASPQEAGYYTLISFNIRDNGRLVKDAQYIDGNTAIVEFIMEKFPASDARDKLYITESWKPVKNYFLQ